VPPSPEFLDSVRKILVLNRNLIGDCLLTTPTLRALKRRFAHAHLAVSIPHAHRDLLAANPYVDEIVPRPRMSRWVAKFQFALDVREAGYDALISFQEKSIFYALAAWHSDAPYTLCLRDRRTRDYYTETVPIEPDVHEVHKNLNVAAFLGCPVEERPVMELQTTPLARSDVEQLVAEEGYDADARFIGINPGGTRSHKRWPVERLGQVAARLQRELNLPVMVFGGPADVELAREAASHLSGDSVVLAGRTSLGQAAAALERCRLFLTGDTGPMHMAVALAVPVVALFGPTNPTKFGPFSSQAIVLRQKKPCATCEDLCLHDLSVEECLEAALQLAKPGHRPSAAPAPVSG